MVILLRGERVEGNVADELRICAAGRVEAERHRDLRGTLEIAVDGLRAADDLRSAAYFLELLGKESAVGVGVVPTDDHQAIQLELFTDFPGGYELLRRLDLVPSAANHVEAARVAVAIHHDVVDLRHVAGEESMRAIAEAVRDRTWPGALHSIVDSRHDVVTSWCLSSAENNADLEALGWINGSSTPQTDGRHAISGGKEALDRLGDRGVGKNWRALRTLPGTTQGARQLWNCPLAFYLKLAGCQPQPLRLKGHRGHGAK
mmetsp:Transcript_20396/g.44451  ORF Transcript_20396/g.44451 Transcript_20396/m.44451 type:complete len:260 (-) Transcript_20396:29-808(-)